MKKITQNLYPLNTKRTNNVLFGLFIGLLASSQMSYGQQSIGTGQFDGGGGFEKGNFTTTVPTTVSIPDATNWSTDSDKLAGTAIKSVTEAGASNVRSGSNSMYFITTATSGTGKYIMSPTLSPALQGSDGTVGAKGPRYTLQYYTTAPSGNTKAAVFIATRGSNAGTTSAATNGWSKVSWSTAASALVADTGTWVGFTPAVASATGYVDDLVVYQPTADEITNSGGFDITNPDAPTTPIVSGLDVSWTAPATGLDGGGYMVVRYAKSPESDSTPNANGIYAVGNTITNGAKALIGKVVYVGIDAFFSDNVAGSVPGSDFYRIYTVDKAFNYSPALTTVAINPLGTNSFSKESDVIVYTKDNKVLLSNIKSKTNVAIYSLTGALVKSADVNEDSGLTVENGVYIVKVKNAEGEKTAKVIVQ
jgi:trimeric autotransporter adhesin